MAEYTVKVQAREAGDLTFRDPITGPRAHKFDDGLDAINRVVHELTDLAHLVERDGSHLVFRLTVEGRMTP